MSDNKGKRESRAPIFFFMIIPKMGRKPHQGIGYFLWSVVWLALFAYSPERFRGHNSLPIIQQGLVDTFLQPVGFLEVKGVYLVHLNVFVLSSCILDMSVRSTQVHEVIF